MSPSLGPRPSKRPVDASGRPKKRRKTHQDRSIWTGADNDWDTLVTDSQLSTASISARRPLPRGLQSLVACASTCAARAFKRMWEDKSGGLQHASGNGMGERWKEEWEWVPDHLRAVVRDKIFEIWGSYLTPEIITDVFEVPPTLYLPGHQLAAVSTAERSRPFRPRDDLPAYTTLILTQAAKVTDTGLAEIIYHLPNLEEINLKGCSLAKDKVVKTIVDRCPNLRRVNVKGTAVTEQGVQQLLDRFGQQLTGVKIDDTLIENVNAVFASSPYPAITHLCLPGDMLNISRTDQSHTRLFGGSKIYPVARPTPESSIIDWPTLSTTFPSLTHLYLPRSLIPTTQFGLRPQTLVKLSLSSDPPFPLVTLMEMVKAQTRSLRKISFGYLSTPAPNSGKTGQLFHDLGEALSDCNLESFKLVCRDTRVMQPVMDMNAHGHSLWQGMRGSWRGTMIHLHLEIGQPVDAELFAPVIPDAECPVLESLSLPGVKITDSRSFVMALTAFRRLRDLDLSATAVDDEDIFILLDHCALLSRIDLTSCRGVRVQHRRTIFKAWQESRDPAPAPTGRRARRR